jgi:hypothetical protein
LVTARYDELRRRAKAINFGIPGGEGVDTLRDYVASQYGVVLTRDEAAAYRSRVVHDVYPELGAYLTEDALQLLAHGLDCDVSAVWNFFGFRGAYSLVKFRRTLNALKQIVRG